MRHSTREETRSLTAADTIYDKLAPVYDVIYGVTLEPGRRRALRRLAPASGESVLEIGVGTGLSAVDYPDSCRVVGIDISPRMIARARSRLGRRGVRHVSLCIMDAQRLAFSDASFDAVYAPYVLNVLPDPVFVAREMARVCRPSGRIVMLNHFDATGRSESTFASLLGKCATHFDINWHVDLEAVLDAAGLHQQSVEHVNLARVSSVVVCRKGMTVTGLSPHTVTSGGRL